MSEAANQHSLLEGRKAVIVAAGIAMTATVKGVQAIKGHYSRPGLEPPLDVSFGDSLKRFREYRAGSYIGVISEAAVMIAAAGKMSKPQLESKISETYGYRKAAASRVRAIAVGHLHDFGLADGMYARDDERNRLVGPYSYYPRLNLLIVLDPQLLPLHPELLVLHQAAERLDLDISNAVELGRIITERLISADARPANEPLSGNL